MSALETERTAVERLRRLDAAKNEFVSTVSHELRTPVTSIVGYTEMLKDGSIVDPLEHQLPMLDTIARNGERLIDICNDLLLLGNLDSGAAALERDHVDLGADARPRRGVHPSAAERARPRHRPSTGRPSRCGCWATGSSSSGRSPTC